MRIGYIFTYTVIFIICSVTATTIVTPLFPYKDGEASFYGYSGSEKDIIVDGGTLKVIAWVTFLTDGINLTEAAGARLLLYVNDITVPGNLNVYRINVPVTKPEDHVSMAPISARKCREIVRNAEYVTAIELLCGVQGLDFLKPLQPGNAVKEACSVIRTSIPFLENDRPLHQDIHK